MSDSKRSESEAKSDSLEDGVDGPHIIEGTLFVDDRGSVTFINDFRLDGLRRFYIVANHSPGFIRAWHAHREECKYVMTVSGSAIVAAVKVDDWERPSKDLPIHRYVLSAQKPTILCIPNGYAHGTMTLTADTKVVFFSDASLEESQQDDFRYDAYYWDAWKIVPR